MLRYLIRRLVLLPITLFCITLVNFLIVNLAPGDPVTVTEVTVEGGAARRQDRSMAFGSDNRYLQFREFYGLTLPILFNDWPWITQKETENSLSRLAYRRETPEKQQEMSVKEYDALRIRFGDQARFIMPHLLRAAQDRKEAIEIRQTAIRFFVRGATRQAFLGPDLTEEQKAYNRKIAQDNNLVSDALTESADAQKVDLVAAHLNEWYQKNKAYYHFEPTQGEKIKSFFFETRFFRYMRRVAFLDFGVLREDPNKTVLSETTRRFKYSLTLAILPMGVTFILCQCFGLAMALWQNRGIDLTLNFLFLILYAIPVFVAAPFLIEIAIHKNFPLTDIPIPLSGFTSADSVYNQEMSYQRLFDILLHLFLPLIALLYGGLAAQSRLSRAAFLETLKQDFVVAARARGLSRGVILMRYVGRNAAITIVTSIAGSLGVILGGSLIVETLFEINGFGKFFYEAILNRDYNVIMFSALAGSFLSLVGYLTADIAYTALDPRLTLE